MEIKMVALFVVFSLLTVGLSDGIKEYAHYSNGKNEYQLVWADPCPGGLRPSGYALAKDRVLLKQVNEDGQIGPVCTD
jgi:hypothetical protein